MVAKMTAATTGAPDRATRRLHMFSKKKDPPGKEKFVFKPPRKGSKKDP